MRIGLSGQSGFLGTNLFRYLAPKHQVRVFPKLNKAKINREKEVEISNCDVFIHAAEPADNDSYSPEFKSLAMENCNVLANILGEKLIYISSVLVYGLGSSILHDENDAPRPFNNYTEHKAKLEDRLKIFNSQIFRISNLVGIGMHESTAIRQLSQKIKKNESFEFEPNSQRDYICICDICEIFEGLLMQRDKKLINIGTGVGTSTKELIQIIKTSGLASNLTLEVHEKLKPEQSCLPNVSLLRSLLPHQRYTPLSAALKPILSKEFL